MKKFSSIIQAATFVILPYTSNEVVNQSKIDE